MSGTICKRMMGWITGLWFCHSKGWALFFESLEADRRMQWIAPAGWSADTAEKFGRLAVIYRFSDSFSEKYARGLCDLEREWNVTVGDLLDALLASAPQVVQAGADFFGLDMLAAKFCERMGRPGEEIGRMVRFMMAAQVSREVREKLMREFGLGMERGQLAYVYLHGADEIFNGLDSKAQKARLLRLLVPSRYQRLLANCFENGIFKN